MRGNALILIVVAYVTLLSLSCRDQVVPAGSPTKTDAIIPLAVGNQWVIRTYSWDSTGFPNVAMIDTDRIVRDTVIQLERWFIWRTGICVTNRSTGYWVLVSSTPELFLKYPTSRNDQYLYGGDTVEVTAVDTSITVSSGTFPCVRYNVKYEIANFVSQVLFVSANKGEIRREIFTRTSSGREYLAIREDLISFQLK